MRGIFFVGCIAILLLSASCQQEKQFAETLRRAVSTGTYSLGDEMRLDDFVIQLRSYSFVSKQNKITGQQLDEVEKIVSNRRLLTGKTFNQEKIEEENLKKKAKAAAEAISKQRKSRRAAAPSAPATHPTFPLWRHRLNAFFANNRVVRVAPSVSPTPLPTLPKMPSFLKPIVPKIVPKLFKPRHGSRKLRKVESKRPSISKAKPLVSKAPSRKARSSPPKPQSTPLRRKFGCHYWFRLSDAKDTLRFPKNMDGAARVYSAKRVSDSIANTAAAGIQVPSANKFERVVYNSEWKHVIPLEKFNKVALTFTPYKGASLAKFGLAYERIAVSQVINNPGLARVSVEALNVQRVGKNSFTAVSTIGWSAGSSVITYRKEKRQTCVYVPPPPPPEPEPQPSSNSSSSDQSSQGGSSSQGRILSVVSPPPVLANTTDASRVTHSLASVRKSPHARHRKAKKNAVGLGKEFSGSGKDAKSDNFAEPSLKRGNGRPSFERSNWRNELSSFLTLTMEKVVASMKKRSQLLIKRKREKKRKFPDYSILGINTQPIYDPNNNKPNYQCKFKEETVVNGLNYKQETAIGNGLKSIAMANSAIVLILNSPRTSINYSLKSIDFEGFDIYQRVVGVNPKSLKDLIPKFLGGVVVQWKEDEFVQGKEIIRKGVRDGKEIVVCKIRAEKNSRNNGLVDVEVLTLI
jgi:hypothetical protein